MPLLSRSRDLSLLHPVLNRSNSPIPSTNNLLFIGLDIEQARSTAHFSLPSPCCRAGLLTGLNLGGHQTDLIDGRSLGDVDGLGHGLIFEIRISLDENDPLGSGLEDLLQAWPEFV